MQRKRNPLALLVGMQTSAATLENSMEVPQKLKMELPYDPAITLLGIYPKDTKILIWRDTYIQMFIVALSTTVKLWKEPKCPSADKWIKMWYIYIHTRTHTHTHKHTHTHTMEYYWDIKKNEILLFATTWMELEYIMLSEISQRKTNITWFHLYVNLRYKTDEHKGTEAKIIQKQRGRQTLKDS